MILEAIGDTVPFEITITLPPRVISNKISLTFTPSLSNDSIKTIFHPFTISCNEANDTNYFFCASKGAAVTVKGYFMNFEQLKDSYFIIQWTAESKGKNAILPERLVGYGISQIYHYSPTDLRLKPDFDLAKTRMQLEAMNIKNSETYYILAVVCARMYDEVDVMENLASALQASPSLAERLLHDVEFVGYRKTEWFQQWVIK